jgi:hypothetical protein
VISADLETPSGIKSNFEIVKGNIEGLCREAVSNGELYDQSLSPNLSVEQRSRRLRDENRIMCIFDVVYTQNTLYLFNIPCLWVYPYLLSTHPSTAVSFGSRNVVLAAVNGKYISTNPRDMKKRYFEISIDTNKRFVERPQILHSLEYAMGLTGDVRRGKERVVLTGMGGSGKTELAIRSWQYALLSYTGMTLRIAKGSTNKRPQLDRIHLAVIAPSSST